MRANWDAHAIKWRDEILAKAEKNTRTLHFTKLSHQQRVVACQHLAKKPIRGICVMSNKQSIQAGTFPNRNQYYWYLTRYVIERVSWTARDTAKQGQGDGRVKITFSRRGGMSYQEFRDYLVHLRDHCKTRIYWAAIDIDGIDAFDHSTNAGLQLADVVASAMAGGVDPDHYGNCESRYAEHLKPIIYCNGKNYLSYGAKIVPNPNNLVLAADQQRFMALFK